MACFKGAELGQMDLNFSWGYISRARKWGGCGGPHTHPSAEMVIEDMRESRAEGGVFRGIFTADDGMIGVVSCVPSNYEGIPDIAFILLLMISAPHRRHGIGTRTVCLVEKNICRNPGVKSILSAVQVNNPDAIRFWSRCGYDIIGKPEPRPDKTTVLHLRKDLTA